LEGFLEDLKTGNVIPSRKLTYPTWGKGTSSSKGYILRFGRFFVEVLIGGCFLLCFL